MCRIYGHYGDATVPARLLREVGDAMWHGGPDAQTCWVDEHAALGSNRLAIQGITDGDQPFQLDGLVAVFNGEIYNHRSLRAELAGQGYRFHGDCDGDVLLPLYQRYGDDFVSHLEGMFAIAIVDSAQACLKLFTDPAGMKSLYYFRCRDGLFFASELQALSRFEQFPSGLDPLAVDRYLGGRAVWGPGTIYRDVHTMAPGSCLRFGSGQLRVTAAPVPSYPLDAPDHGLTLAGAAERFEQLMRTELTQMLDADVPVCVITSGGLDSSYLTALAAQQVPALASFNIAYTGDWPSDERAFADEVAAHCGTEHHQVMVDPADFPAVIDRFIAHLDQPNNAPHSLSTYALFEAIHQAGFKVALTGDGADELFGGYARYVRASRDDSPDWHRRYQNTMAAGGTGLLSQLYTADFAAEVRGSGGYFVDRSGDELARRVAERLPGTSKLDVLLRYDQFERFPYYILRRVDHLSMAHSVEARIPFLQPRLMSFAHGLPAELKVVGEQVKAPVAEAARKWLPPSIIKRPKQPFTLPITAMIRPGQALYELIADLLLVPGRRCAAVIEQDGIDELFRLQTKEPTPHAAELLWSVLMLECWLAARDLRL